MSLEFTAVIQETVEQRRYFSHWFNNDEFLRHVAGECKHECSKKKFKSIALKAVDQLLEQCLDACTAVVYKIVNQRTVYYVAKCRPNEMCEKINRKISMRGWYLCYPNLVGTDLRIRGRVSGGDASQFLRELLHPDLKAIVPKKKIKLL